MDTMALRGRDEAEGLVVDAREHVAMLQGTRFVDDLQRGRAILATVPWVLGGGPAPVTGEVTGVPDQARRAREEVAGESAERTAREAQADSTYPGVVAETLSWLRGHPRTERPL